MDKTISVHFPVNGMETPVVVSYFFSMIGNIHVIHCSINKSEDKNHLQLHKFDMKSEYSDGMYVALFNEELQRKNMNTTLFVDKVYTEIMEKEQMTVNKEYLL